MRTTEAAAARRRRAGPLVEADKAGRRRSSSFLDSASPDANDSDRGRGSGRSKLRTAATRAGVGVVLLLLAYAAMQTRPENEAEVATEPGAFQRILGAESTVILKPGARLPDLELTALDGSRSRLADFRGRPLWVNIWASWCPPCRAEMPDIDALNREFAPQGLAVAAISIREPASDVSRFIKTTGYTLPVFVSPDGRAADALGVTGLPTHYFADRDGIVRDVRYGGMNESTMRSKLAKIL